MSRSEARQERGLAEPARRSRSPGEVNLDAAPKWRNWQTRRTQNPVGLTPRVGSTPTFGTRALGLATVGRRRRALPAARLVATCVATNMKKGARGGKVVSPALRRAGLKIRWGSRPVWVRLPPSALALLDSQRLAARQLERVERRPFRARRRTRTDKMRP